jgi:beta-lactamase class A
MTILDLAKAAQQLSDNTAANLLIHQLGGPTGVTAKLRALGDPASRLDRYEPAMNLVLPGETHDTTTPRAMASGMRAYLLGRTLKPASRDLLTGWMIQTQTGARRLRAGLPPTWRAGDKTGSSWNDTAMVDKVNDIAIVWPPHRAPIIVTAYLDGAKMSKAIRPEDETILVEVARIVAGAFA